MISAQYPEQKLPPYLNYVAALYRVKHEQGSVLRTLALFYLFSHNKMDVTVTSIVFC